MTAYVTRVKLSTNSMVTCASIGRQSLLPDFPESCLLHGLVKYYVGLGKIGRQAVLPEQQAASPDFPESCILLDFGGC